MWERRDRKEKDWVKEREKGVNRVSDQGLVPLDVAALTHNSPLLHVLAKAGARHNPVCELKEKKTQQLCWMRCCSRSPSYLCPLSVPASRVGI